MCKSESVVANLAGSFLRSARKEGITYINVRQKLIARYSFHRHSSINKCAIEEIGADLLVEFLRRPSTPKAEGTISFWSCSPTGTSWFLFFVFGRFRLIWDANCVRGDFRNGNFRRILRRQRFRLAGAPPPRHLQRPRRHHRRQDEQALYLDLGEFHDKPRIVLLWPRRWSSSDRLLLIATRPSRVPFDSSGVATETGSSEFEKKNCLQRRSVYTDSGAVYNQ